MDFFTTQLRVTKEKKQQRDGRLTLILILGYFFILSFALPGTIFQHAGLAEDRNFDLKTSLILSHGSPSSIPADLTPFFFKKLPINSAGKELLMTVKGVGPKLAESIIDARTQIGFFHSHADLLDIKGVGLKRAIYFETVFSYNIPDEQ
ncbi:MAG: helix-hairpin-helix domain-containing protein [Deltaproteobacteria bacterium]|nr:helix-hairpin-helix domain-containing protein [Deltaproteobacteria bacterium]